MEALKEKLGGKKPTAEQLSEATGLPVAECTKLLVTATAKAKAKSKNKPKNAKPKAVPAPAHVDLAVSSGSQEASPVPITPPPSKRMKTHAEMEIGNL